MVDTIWLLYLGISPFVLATLIIYKLGGPREAYFRLSRIPYFAITVFLPDGSEVFEVLRYSLIQRHSPAMFSFNGKMRQIDDKNMGRHNGRPKWFFNWDDMTALPIMHWNGGNKIDPSLIDGAWNNKFLEDLSRLGQKGSPLLSLLIVIMVIATIALVIGAVSTYYSHDALCAIKPGKC
jgi:hypothetical protein